MPEKYTYNKHTGQIWFGIFLIFIAFLAIGSLLSYQSGSSPNLGSSYASLGNSFGEFFWEVFIFLILAIGFGMIFYYHSLNVSSEKLAKIGDKQGLNAINPGIYKVKVSSKSSTEYLSGSDSD